MIVQIVRSSASIDLKLLEEEFGIWHLSEVPEHAIRVGDRKYDDRLDEMDLDLLDRWKVPPLTIMFLFVTGLNVCVCMGSLSRLLNFTFRKNVELLKLSKLFAIKQSWFAQHYLHSVI